MLEAKLFNTGLRAPTPFQIIPDGTYFIYTFSLERVVLAVQNVKDLLRSPFNKRLAEYFPSDAASSVVGVNTKGGDNEKVIEMTLRPLFLIHPQTHWLHSGTSLQPNMDIHSETWGQVFISEFPQN
jgi:hypothetical protein